MTGDEGKGDGDDDCERKTDDENVGDGNDERW